MIDNSTFSLVVEDYEYVWKVKTLLRYSKNIEVINWPIPDSFLLEWSWEDENINDHIERCLKANLKHPILVWDNKILDGCHRVIKALATRQSDVRAKVIRDIPAPDKILDFNHSKQENNSKYNFEDIVKIVKTRLSL